MGEIAKTVEKTIGTLISPITKLVDAFCNACGKIYEPHYIKKMAKARAFELKTISDAIESNSDLSLFYDNGVAQINNTDLNNLTLRAMRRALYQETVKQQNVENVIQKTVSLLENTPDVTSEPIEQDWMIRFINSIEDISDDDIQLLWAKILAGEIKSPKSYSLRTIETLRNMSKDEALLFQKLSSYVIEKDNSCFFVSDTNFNNNFINISQILHLSDCGLVSDATFLHITYKIAPNNNINFNNNNIIILCQNNNLQEITLSFGIHALTNVGKNLIKIIGSNTDDAFFLEFGKFIKQKYSNLEIKAYKIISVDRISNKITYNADHDLLI